MADLQLFVHVLFDQMHGNVPRAFNHGLHVVAPGDFGQFPERFQLAELRRVVGIGNTSRTQTVPKGKGHVILLHDFTDLFKMSIQKILLMMREAPLGQDRPAARDNPRHTFGRQRYVTQQNPGMHGKVIDPLLGLLN